MVQVEKEEQGDIKSWDKAGKRGGHDVAGDFGLGGGGIKTKIEDEK